MNKHEPDWERQLASSPLPGRGFNEQLRRQVEEKIQTKGRSRRLAPWLAGLTAAAAAVVFLISQGNPLRNSVSDSVSQGDAQMSSRIDAPVQPPKKYEDKQKELQYRMWSATSRYNTVTGDFYDSDQRKVSFSIIEGDNPRSLIQETQDGNNHVTVMNGKKLLTIVKQGDKVLSQESIPIAPVPRSSLPTELTGANGRIVMREDPAYAA